MPTSPDKKCPNCHNFLEYFISDDFYFKGKKFYSCEVCDWKPQKSACPNGCNGGTVCSSCPLTN